ncbi:transcription factor GTE12-like [Rhizophagus clarus]|uniref:Transcription factor GTE12-like n=1 Tax=Rhizophagus clarus TaxID=94130 RepID=A0A8H3MBX3_9GLOM|nr:transcription factor GTE12-like [Rhizophagus clarus]
MNLTNIDGLNNMDENNMDELNNADSIMGELNIVEFDNMNENNVDSNMDEFNIDEMLINNTNELNNIDENNNMDELNNALSSMDEFNMDELNMDQINNTDGSIDELDSYFDDYITLFNMDGNTDELNDMDKLNYFDVLNNINEINNTDESNDTDNDENYMNELIALNNTRISHQFFNQYIQINAVTNKYLGQDIIISYIKEKHTNISYHEFLILHYDVIFISSLSFISSLLFSNWKTFDNYWAFKFLEEVEKSKLNKKNTFDILKEKINKEQLQYEKFFQIYWQKLIKKYKKENLIPGATYTKKTIKIHDLPKIINPNLLFCYEILCELIGKPFSFPFYKYTKELNPDYFDIINNQIDLFTIKSKLENNQYSDAKKFKEDIDLLIANNSIYYDINNDGGAFYNLTIMFNSTFNTKWNKKIQRI